MTYKPKITKDTTAWSSHFSHRIQEGFAEFTSIIYHLISITCKLSYLYNIKNPLDLLSDIIQIEQVWSVFVVAKILYLYGYSTDDVHTFFEGTGKNKIMFSEIAVIPYYFIKSILLFNIFEITTSTYLDPDLKPTDHYPQLEYDLVINISKNIKYMSLLQNCMKYISMSIDLQTSPITESVGYICLELDDNSTIQKIVEQEYGTVAGDIILASILNEIQVTNYNKKGGNSYYHKYLKYKQKYTNLKNKSIHQCD